MFHVPQTAADMHGWQCDKNLPQCLDYMFTNQVNCDTVFDVGDNHDIIKAHSSILISRSPVFYSMIAGPLAQTGQIRIPDIQADVFNSFLRFLYTDVVTINTKFLVELRYVAKKYCVDLLAEECLCKIISDIRVQNACSILKSAVHSADEEVFNLAMLRIEKQTAECLNSEDLLSLDPLCIQTITASDDLTIEESKLYWHVIKWSSAECKRQNLSDDWRNRRCVLGPILYNIRFPIMNKRFLIENVDTPLLLETEKEELLLDKRVLSGSSDDKDDVEIFNSKQTVMSDIIIPSVHNHSTLSSTSFSCNKRKGVKNVMRFLFSEDCYSDSMNSINSIVFSVSDESILHGILLYSHDSKECRVNVYIDVKERCSGQSLVHCETTAESNPKQETVPVALPNSITLSANCMYKIDVRLNGRYTLQGNHSLTNVEISGKVVVFYYSTVARDGNEVYAEHGQIPGLQLS